MGITSIGVLLGFQPPARLRNAIVPNGFKFFSFRWFALRFSSSRVHPWIAASWLPCLAFGFFGKWGQYKDLLKKVSYGDFL
jgi:hypothetical protein